jgi:hypothetical protein
VLEQPKDLLQHIRKYVSDLPVPLLRGWCEIMRRTC